jgi:multiple PDZ domain protein
VNGTELLNMNHVEVVALLKELSTDVCLVCSRPNQLIDELADKSEVLSSFLHSGANKASETLSLGHADRLVKAKSDGSLAIVNPNGDFSRCKSRSLEPLSGLAMWSTESQLIELIKSDRGLGFSILDYQVNALSSRIKGLPVPTHLQQCFRHTESVEPERDRDRDP